MKITLEDQIKYVEDTIKDTEDIIQETTGQVREFYRQDLLIEKAILETLINLKFNKDDKY